MMLGGENLIGNMNWTNFSQMDYMSMKWLFFNSTLVNMSLFVLFSDKPTHLYRFNGTNILLS